MKRPLQLLILLLVAGLALLPSVAPAASIWTPRWERLARSPLEVGDRNHFEGEVTALSGPADNPTGIVIELGTLSMVAAISPRAVLVARSGEADVEGLQVHDYVVMTARRIKGAWTATRIQYDVVPIPPLRLLTGTVRRVEGDWKRVAVKLDKGGTVVARIVPQTVFVLDGQILDGEPQNPVGFSVQVLCRRTPNALVAYKVSLKSTS